MNEALLVVLAFLWALVLLPGAIRARRTSIDSTVGGFNRAMEVLRSKPDAGAGARQLMVPEEADRIVSAPVGEGAVPVSPQRITPAQELLERRRKLFVQMLAGSAGLMVLALIFGGVTWLLFLLSVGALGGYSLVLRRWKLQRDEAREVVREIAGRESESSRVLSGRQAEVAQRLRAAGGVAVATRPNEPWEPQSSVRIRLWDDAQ